MPNKSYQKGYRKEREIVNKARAKGKIAYRSAGSHSDIDVTIIDHKKFEIELIQVKNKKYISPKEKAKYAKLLSLNGEYLVKTKIK